MVLAGSLGCPSRFVVAVIKPSVSDPSYQREKHSEIAFRALPDPSLEARSPDGRVDSVEGIEQDLRRAEAALSLSCPAAKGWGDEP